MKPAPQSRRLLRQAFTLASLVLTLLCPGAARGAPGAQADAPTARRIASAADRTPGAAELSIDRATLKALLSAALPLEIPISVPRFGALTLRITAPESLDLRDGGVEARLGAELKELRIATPVSVRYVPEIVPETGIARLRAETARPEFVLPVQLDLAPLLPPVELPRSFQWTVSMPSGGEVRLQCLVQGIVVGEDRLVLQLGVVVRP